MAKSSTTIDKESRKNIPARGKAKKTLMLDAIRSVCGDEHKFLKKVILLGLGDGKDLPANHTLLTLVLNRIEPPLKAISPMVNFEFNPDAKPHEQASQVLQAVASSEIAPDIGQMFVSSIKSMIDIEECTDLKERIERLEAALNGDA